MRTGTAFNGDVRIHFDTFGDPNHPTLLLVNGLGSQCINYREAWCEMFAAEGAKTVLAARRKNELDEIVDGITKKGGTAMAVPTDVTQEDQVLEASRAPHPGVFEDGQLAIDEAAADP